MIVQQIANSHNDEFYTPEYAVAPILKYLPKDSFVWCPFDTDDSHFVKMIKQAGHLVAHTHLKYGADFMSTTPLYGVTHIISNPPYSIKTEVLKRCFDLGIPFAMLVGIVGLFESQRRFDMFNANAFEIMYLNRRVSYFKNYTDQKPSLNPPFSSVYLCKGMLPKQIVFEEIKK